jgi:hypothetical protein
MDDNLQVFEFAESMVGNLPRGSKRAGARWAFRFRQLECKVLGGFALAWMGANAADANSKDRILEVFMCKPRSL